MIRLLYFGFLRELAGTDSEMIELGPAERSLSALISRIEETRPRLAEAVRRTTVKTAVDDCLVAGDVQLRGDEEIAFLPPVSGG